MKYISIFISLVIQLCIFCTCISIKNKDDTPQLVPSDTLKQTVFALTLDQEMKENINIVYSPGFQAAWQHYTENIPGGEITLTEDPEIAGLSNRQVNTDYQNIYFGLAGICGEGIIEQINSRLKQPEEIPCEPGNLVLYGYSETKITCQVPFEGGHTIEFGNEMTKVRTFGFKNLDLSINYYKMLCDQLSLDFYKQQKDVTKTEFIVTVQTLLKDYELILAKVIPGETLRHTIQYVLDKKSGSDPLYIGTLSDFLVPVFSLNLVHHFTSLEGKMVSGEPPVKIGQAMEKVKFVFSENGQKYGHLSFAINIKSNYTLVFDTAFLLLLKRKDTIDPDFALWIANAELLQEK